jgi:hypothetical protein
VRSDLVAALLADAAIEGLFVDTSFPDPDVVLRARRSAG